MRALRVVGIGEDGDVVLEDPVRLERYTVPADERLRAAARGDLTWLGQSAIEVESQLRPREIQARIRAGASVDQVAEAAGVPPQKIERFAYPVLLERSRTAEVAQRAHPVRADGPDNRTLGEVVAHTFGLRGQSYEGAKWDSWKGEDGRWVVALSWRAGRSDNRAHWTFQPGAHGGTVTAVDEHASDLVEGLPARPLRTVGPVIDMARPEDAPPPGPSPVEQWRAAASDSYRERLPLGPDGGRPAQDRPTTRTAPEPWRSAPPAQRQSEPVVEARAEQAGDDRAAPKPELRSRRPAEEAAARSTAPPDATAAGSGTEPAAPAGPAEPAPSAEKQDDVAEEPAGGAAAVPTTPDAVTEEPEPDAAPEPEAAPAAESPAPGGTAVPSRRTKKGKPVMPSWDEVLLGVRGPR